MLLRQVCTVLVVIGLAACVTILPEAEPVTLYRLEAGIRPAQGHSVAPRLSLLKMPTRFTAAAATDRIMTVTDGQVAYLAGARWASPAPVLFDEALSRAFDAGAVGTSLVGYDGAGRARHSITVEVSEFAAFYRTGTVANPTVRMRVAASIVRRRDGQLVSERTFEAIVPTAANRVSIVVGAYDAALGQVLSEIVAWADETTSVEKQSNSVDLR